MLRLGMTKVAEEEFYAAAKKKQKKKKWYVNVCNFTQN